MVKSMAMPRDRHLSVTAHTPHTHTHTHTHTRTHTLHPPPPTPLHTHPHARTHSTFTPPPRCTPPKIRLSMLSFVRAYCAESQYQNSDHRQCCSKPEMTSSSPSPSLPNSPPLKK